MYPSRVRQLTSVVALLIALGLSSVNPAPAQAQTGPDFSNVDDILNGTRLLLRRDDIVFGYQGAFGLFTSQDSTLTSSNDLLFSVGDGTNRYSQPAVVGARLFNIASDVAVTLVLDRNSSLLQWRLDTSTATVASGTVGMAGLQSDNESFLAVVAGDFTGDGFDEIVVFPKGPLSSTEAIVGTAVDTQDPSQGLKFGPPFPLFQHVLPFSITKAAVLGQPRVFVAGPIASNTSCASGFSGLQFESYPIDSTSLALGSVGTFGATIPEGTTACLHTADMTAGRFTSDLHDQLLVTYGMEGGNVKVLPFDLNDQGIAVQQPIYDTNYIIGGGGAFIRSGRFDLSSPVDAQGIVDQAALFISNGFNAPGINTLRILSFDQNFTTTAGPEAQVGSSAGECAFDMVVGNFDHQQANPTPPPATIADPHLQVAIPFTDCDKTLALRIFDVASQTQPKFQISVPPISNLNFNPSLDSGKGGSVFTSTLATVDLQGRSLRLGPPQKVTVTSNIQPQVVLGMPPMHIDFIQDANSLPNGTPTELNLTVFPSIFNAQYDTQIMGSNQSSNTNTTSYTVGTKGSATAKLSYGIPDVASVSAELTTSAAQTHDNTVAAKYNTYGSNTFDVSTTTGFSDQVWFTSKRFNMYIYPVIGQEASGCPDSAPTCPDEQKVPLPLHVIFSGPDQVVPGRVDGSLLEWYQPLQEPGNVFSYPSNVTLLENLYPGFTPLTADPATRWATDTSSSTVNITWTTGSGSDQTSGSVSTQSFDIAASVSADVNIGGFGASVSGGFDYNSSSANSTLNESSSMVGSSTGVRIVKPGFNSDYTYVAQTYIFGQMAPTGTVQQIPLGTAVQSSGPLWTAFTADPTDTTFGASAWWPQAYTKPDVALNHPLRWTWSRQTDVVTFNTANPNNPALSDFYYMKGLYITPASANGRGSQIIQAPAGELLQLQARVYNYSLTDMPAGTTVKVRFYGQEWDNTAAQVIAGTEFVINTDDDAPLNNITIPGFRGGQTTTLNWALASTTFDTTNHSNTYLIFWVVVWMEQNGQLVSEMPEHGITAIPGAMTSPTAVAIEKYSNNVGFYKQPFYVCPQEPCTVPSALTAVAATRVAATAQPLTVERVKITPPQVQGFEPVTVTATLATAERSLSGVHVVFSDGDPQQGGEAFDAELIPHIRANDIYVTQVKFHPRTCGTHTVFVVAGEGTAASATDTARITVKCK